MNKHKIKKVFNPSVAFSSGDDDPIGDALRASAVAYWKMDETAHITRMDSTANNLDLVYQAGTVSSESGKVSNALVCGDADSQLTASDATGLASFGNTDFSLALWFKIPGAQVNGFGYVLSRWDAVPATGFEYALWVEDYGTDEYYFVFDPQAGFVDNTSFGQLSFDTWYFAIAEYHAIEQKCKLRMNNSSLDEGNLSQPSTEAGTTLFLGHGDIESFIGSVDELGIYNRILTADERAYLYNGGSGRTLYP